MKIILHLMLVLDAQFIKTHEDKGKWELITSQFHENNQMHLIIIISLVQIT